MQTNCCIKYKCVDPDYEYVIRRSDESSFDSKVKCNENELKNCYNITSKKCIKICPIDCLRDEHKFNSYVKFNENKNLKVHYYFWDSREAFSPFEETADMLLIDYFTCIGGLFGLWFGICLESLLDLIVKHTRNLRTKVKLQVKKLLSFLCISSLSILHFINDLITNFINYMFEKVLSIKNRMSQFRVWFSDWLEFLFDMILTHARIWRFKLKLYSKTFFSFTLTLIKFLISFFINFVFSLKSMIETQVKKLLLLIYLIYNYILKCIHDMIVMCINYVKNKNYCTHNRVESIHL
jgi:hypothetical protein